MIMDFSMDYMRQLLLTEHLWVAVVVAVFAVIVLVAWYAKAPFSTFKNLNVPGPAPWPFVGNLPEIAKKPGQLFLFHKQLVEKYGSVCGYYEGRQPVYVISDPELLKLILVKEFNKFVNRPMTGSAPAPTNKGLLKVKDEDWKRIRVTVSPTFSALKLKQIVPLVNEACTTLEKILEKTAESGKSVNMWRVYGKYTMQVILAAAFGVQADVQTDPDEPYTGNAETLFQPDPFLPLLVAFPFVKPLLLMYMQLMTTAGFTGKRWASLQFLLNTADEVIQMRLRQMEPSQRKDLLELMLRAEITDSGGKQVSKLSTDEIVAQSFTFILAGYETTSNTLAFTTYNLALNSDVQDKLIQEIDDAVEDSETTDYDTVNNLEYLDMVISETLRLFPPGFRFGRTCNETCTLNGVHFPKGVALFVPVYQLHRDPEYWPDPETFDPERFSPEVKQQRNPYCYLPFGTGPRSCIGMRFALMEAKMALVHILKRFKFESCPETEVPLQLAGFVTMAPKNGIRVKIVPRD